MYEHLASETETRYAKTEKEALTYTWAMEKLSKYVFDKIIV